MRMLGVWTTIYLFVLLVVFLSVDQIDGQASPLPTYSIEDAQRHRCLMRNRGRQRAVSKCFTHFTMRNCSLLNEHMECYIREKKRICQVAGDKLIDKTFRNLLERKFIQSTKTGCGRSLVKELNNYECRDCTFEWPKLNFSGDTPQIKEEIKSGCKVISIICRPRNTDWISTMEITEVVKGVSSNRILNSTALGEPIEFRLFCPKIKNFWMDQDNKTITNIKCTNNAYAAHFLHDGCGTCDQKWIEFTKDLTADMKVTEYFIPTEGCRRLKFECIPYPSFNATTRVNDDLTTKATSLVNQTAIRTFVCVNQANTPEWRVEDMATYTQPITKATCNSSFAGTTPLGYGCGQCVMRGSLWWDVDSAVKPNPTDKGCIQATVECRPTTTDDFMLGFNEAFEIWSVPPNNITMDITCVSKAPDGVSGHSSWVVKDPEGRMLVVESIRCQTARMFDPDYCVLCNTTTEPIHLENIEVLGEYTGGTQHCRRLRLICRSESPSFKSEIEINQAVKLLSKAGESVETWVECDFDFGGFRWENAADDWIRRVTCNPRAEPA